MRTPGESSVAPTEPAALKFGDASPGDYSEYALNVLRHFERTKNRGRGNSGKPPSNSTPLPFKEPAMIHVQRGGECETCGGDQEENVPVLVPATMLNPTSATCGELKTDGTRCSQNQESRPSDSFLKLSHPPMNGPMPECEICEGEHPDSLPPMNSPTDSATTSAPLKPSTIETAKTESPSSDLPFTVLKTVNYNYGAGRREMVADKGFFESLGHSNKPSASASSSSVGRNPSGGGR